MNIPEIIARKRDRQELSRNQIEAVVMGFVRGETPAEQVAAWLMACLLNGMTPRETTDLTEIMRDSGDKLDLSGVPGPHVDKHSTGGVGDKTTLVVIPILAAAGITCVKMSGRGLGYSGGTVDKLESIPGFQSEQNVNAMLAQARDIRACLVGQSAALVPADKLLYGLRDVTATVPSLPLIASSIMSKKLAGGAEHIMLDVKTGSGAFMPTLEEARNLAKALVEIGRLAGRSTVAAITDMNQPLGRTVGNALEVAEATVTLQADDRADKRFLTLCAELSAHALRIALGVGEEEAARRVEEALRSGAALEKLKQIVAAQGGDTRVLDDTSLLPQAPVKRTVKADRAGWISWLDAKAVGIAAVELGAGRLTRNAAIDPAVGFELEAHVGDAVNNGDPMATVHARTEADADRAEKAFRDAVRFSEEPVGPLPLIYEFLD